MDRLTKFRRDLHQIPEVAFKEYKTHAYLKQVLESLGFSTKTYLETDVIVFINNNKPKTIAFRSDIDALPQEEKSGVTFKSKHPGNMHACGHDAHMAMLLEFAHYLKANRHSLNYNVLLIFQPAEEQIGGAKKLIEKGLFKDYPVEAIFGIHVYPGIDEGVIASRPGPFMAQANELTIEIHGKSAHGAMPHLGIDANHIACKYFQMVYDAMEKHAQDKFMVCTFGKIAGGTVKNIISEYALLEGTMRTFNHQAYQTIENILLTTKQTLEKAYGCKIDVTIHDGYPPTNNDPQLYAEFKALLKHPLHEFKTPLLVAEDFSFYQKEVPGVFFYIGVKNEAKGYSHSLHSSYFNLDESALNTGVEAYINIIKSIKR